MISQESKALVKKAADVLSIKDVVLYGAKFDQQQPLPQKGGEVEQQQMDAWRFKKTRAGKQEWLQVLYTFGVRLAKPGEEQSSANPEVYYTIEAEFVAHYQLMDADLPEDAIKAFAEFNAKHNIWPFWREHVFATCQRARINPPNIGLYTGLAE